MNTKYLITGFLILSALMPSAFAGSPPAFQNLRYEEDGAAYRDTETAEGLGDLKYIPLNDADSVFLSLGGQARLRWELWKNVNGDSTSDDDFGLLRLRLHGDVQAGEHFRLFIELKSATATRRDLPGGRRTLDVDELDVQNAFIDLSSSFEGAEGTFRLGRQELSFGRQRLVSPLDWSNTRRTWDGARIILNDASWRVDVFAAEFVPVDKYAFNEADSDTKFYGAYTTTALMDTGIQGDVYLLRLDRDDITGGEMTIDDRRYTAGLRMNGACPLTGVEYDIEGGRQFGDAGDLDIHAWFFAAELGYTVKEIDTQPRLTIGYDIASGDKSASDGRTETFNQLFPLGHAYLGAIDLVGRQNIEDFSQCVSIWPIAKTLQIKAEYHTFRRTERTDALYNAGGAVVRAGDAGSAKDVGSEVDLSMMYKINRSTVVLAGYSRFFSGDFIRESGPSSDIDFAFVSMQYMF